MSAEPFDLVGLIPAAGHARRLAMASGSKELIAVPDPTDRHALQPVAAGLIRQMAAANCARVFFITRADKADIAKAFGSGAHYQVPIGYLMIEDSRGPPFTLAAAFSFAPGAAFAVGFPDIMIDPPDALAHLAMRLRTTNADVVMATFPARPGQGVDLACADNEGRITALLPKEQNPVWPENGKTWLLAAWRPSFTAFFEHALQHLREQMCDRQSPQAELPTGAVFASAVRAGLKIDSIHFPNGRFLDIGAPDRLPLAANFYLFER